MQNSSNIIKLLFGIILLASISCKSSKSAKAKVAQTEINRFIRITDCQDRWKFIDQDTSMLVRVIWYYKANTPHFGSNFYAMLICITSKNDTIRIMNPTYKRDLKIGSTIQVRLKYFEKIPTISNIPLQIGNLIAEDEYYCSVTKTYFGELMQ